MNLIVTVNQSQLIHEIITINSWNSNDEFINDKNQIIKID